MSALVQGPIFKLGMLEVGSLLSCARTLNFIRLGLQTRQDYSVYVISLVVRRWPFWQAGENRRPVAEGAEGSCSSACTTLAGEQVPPGRAVTW